MAPAPPSPSGEAIELLSNAAQAWLDGPVAFLRAAADRASDPSSTADTAAADLIGFGAQAARWLAKRNRSCARSDSRSSMATGGGAS